MKRQTICGITALLFTICLSGQVFADLTISPGDIFINTDTGRLMYRYQLKNADMAGAKFTNDVFTVTNAAPAPFLNGNAIVPATGTASASFVFKFDLSSLQLYGLDAYIERVVVRDKIYLDNNILKTEQSTITTSWSTDGSQYNTINTASTPPRSTLEQAETADIDLAGQNRRTFYYRTVFSNTDSNGFNAGLNAWNACDSTSTDFFLVEITISLPGSPSGTYAGGDGSADAPYQIATAAQLNAMGNYPGDWNKHFILVDDIDLSGYTYDGPLISPDHNTEGIYRGVPFSGHFDGNGRTIRNLKLFSSGYPRNWHIGLFGYVTGGHITNLVLEDGLVIGNTDNGFAFGLLAGEMCSATVTNCHVSGTVRGFSEVGGLCGRALQNTTITNCSSRGVINAASAPAGGVVGHLIDSEATGCTFEGMINHLGNTSVWGYGGVCGIVTRSGMSQCSADVLIDLGDAYSAQCGGLVGWAQNMTIENCSAQGAIVGMISSGHRIGGLSGTAQNSHVARSYSACRLVHLLGAGDGLVAGFVGQVDTGGSGVTFVNCFWDTTVSGTSNGAGRPEDPDPAGILGLPTSMMKVRANFVGSGWDFTGETANGTADIWAIRDTETYPMHTGQCVNRPAGDINGDCVVDMLDVAQLSQTWLADDRIQ
jgi:hypothetical protein